VASIPAQKRRADHFLRLPQFHRLKRRRRAIGEPAFGIRRAVARADLVGLASISAD